MRACGNPCHDEGESQKKMRGSLLKHPLPTYKQYKTELAHSKTDLNNSPQTPIHPNMHIPVHTYVCLRTHTHISAVQYMSEKVREVLEEKKRLREQDV